MYVERAAHDHIARHHDVVFLWRGQLKHLRELVNFEICVQFCDVTTITFASSFCDKFECFIDLASGVKSFALQR